MKSYPMLRYVTVILPHQHSHLLELLTQLASILTSKTIPTTGRGSGIKRKRRAPEMIEVEDEDSPRRIAARSPSPIDSSTILEEIPASTQASTSSSATKQAKGNKVRLFRLIDCCSLIT
jgi:hypothetical protein